jgi:hypothetical protein
MGWADAMYNNQTPDTFNASGGWGDVLGQGFSAIGQAHQDTVERRKKKLQAILGGGIAPTPVATYYGSYGPDYQE